MTRPALPPLAAALAAGLLLAAPPLARPAEAQATPTEMKPEERALLRAEVRRYLLEHPEVIMEAVQVLERRRAEAEAEAGRAAVARHMDELANDGYSVVAGNPDGDVTIVEFTDYNCGFCRRAHPETRALLESDPNLRLVIKEFPILGPESRVASEAAMAAVAQGRELYLAFNDAMMRHGAKLDARAVWRIADEVGLDVDRLKADAKDPEIAARIARTQALAQALGIDGTPSFVIGDQVEKGYRPLEVLRERVAEVRAKDG